MARARTDRARAAIVGGIIRQYRRERKIKSQHLAEMIGVTYQQYYKYERGENRISVERFVDICHVLDISPLILIRKIEWELDEAQQETAA